MKSPIFGLLTIGLLFCGRIEAQNVKLTDALDDNCWDCSEWISAANAPVVTGIVYNDRNCRAADGASWFVSTIKNEGRVVSAKWMTTGLGVYQLYLNGKSIGEEILKPGFTHYAKTKISYTYDVTDTFRKSDGATNTLSVQLTPGWWGDKIVTPQKHEGMIGKKCAFRGVLQLTYADGRKKLLGTDTVSWKAGIAGSVTHAAIFDGEEYDARIAPGYMTPEKLSTPEKNTEFSGIIVPTDGAEIYLRRDLALAPVEAYTWSGVSEKTTQNYGIVIKKRIFKTGETMTVGPGDTLVVDFGQNCAGVPEFEFKAAEGVTLTCLPSEILNDGKGARSRGMDGPEGSCHRTNLRIKDLGMILKYTFGAGRKYVTYSPNCTFFGYRYVSVTADGPVSIKSLSSIPVSSISKEMETGTLTTGNDLVNKLISNTIWGERSNYLSVPTDCPQRNERLGWTADTQVFSETGSFFANTDAFFHKWMRDMRDSQSPAGGFPGVAPTSQYGEPMMRFGWADAGVIVPWTIFKQFGDKTIIDENWNAMERYMRHICETKYLHEAIKEENHNYQWGDWLSYESLESCGGGAWVRDANGKRVNRPETLIYWNYLGACYWQLDAQMMSEMAAASDRDSSVYAKMVEEVKAYIRESFVNADGTFKCEILNTMQTPALFALRCQLFEGAAREAVIARLKENLAAHGNCLQTGFLGTSMLMNTLTDNGLVDIAYELLFQRKNPSWLYSVDNGATTIWERWNSYTFESGMGPKGMNSFNHYAYGCVCEWIWKTVCGIASDINNPGFKHIIMKPVPDKRLGYVDASFRSAAGTIESHWRYEGDKWIWTFTIPQGAYATVTLPGESSSKDYQSGTYIIEKRLLKSHNVTF